MDLRHSSLTNFSSDADFTTQHYRNLIVLAKRYYEFVLYGNIPWGSKFVLWRHDCDISLNRAYALAKIEAEMGIFATYFLNPHCEFYNIFEKNQRNIVLEILKMGHQIGLHFDATYYDGCDEISLNRHVSSEASLLEELYGVKPSAFSFHNPESAHLSCDAEHYGGLVNCYSKRFKENVPYCSDSNGYWRYRSLHEVLGRASDPCLQVLTHPDWWQDDMMPPRQRIFRSVFGRAESVMRRNDDLLEIYDRPNHAGSAAKLQFLKKFEPKLYSLCDYLWNSENFQSLFLELWCLYERQINRLCKAQLVREWEVPAVEINRLFDNPHMINFRKKIFLEIFDVLENQEHTLPCDEGTNWAGICIELIQGRTSVSPQKLEEGCIFLCDSIIFMASWGEKQSINYSGISHLESIGIPTIKTMYGDITDRLGEDQKNNSIVSTNKRWNQIKFDLHKINLT
jgi:hypothetical protein